MSVLFLQSLYVPINSENFSIYLYIINVKSIQDKFKVKLVSHDDHLTIMAESHIHVLLLLEQ